MRRIRATAPKIAEVRVAVLLLPLFCGAACSPGRPAIERTGNLRPGAAMIVANARGDVSAYAPALGQPRSQWSFQSFGSDAVNVRESPRKLRIWARANADPARYLVRVPDGVTLDVSTEKGSIHVADVNGVVNAYDADGDIKMLVPQYANARADVGSISVTFGSTDWNGTLHFSSRRGDIELYVNATANARVHLHTQRGTIFTDFPLRGTSRGFSETIDAPINAGGTRKIDVEAANGSIRMLELKPQV